MHSPNKFKVQQLRMRNLTMMVEVVAVIVAVLFVSAVLPSILIRYVYAGQQLFEQPIILEYIPVIGFVIGIGFFVFTLLGNMAREKIARQLERGMTDESCGCGEDCNCHQESMLDEIENLSKKAVSKKTSTRKTGRSKNGK